MWTSHLPWDLFLLSDNKQVDVSDLKRRDFITGFIVNGGVYSSLPPNHYHFESSAEIPVKEYTPEKNNKRTVYAISLLNLISYCRIGKAIHLNYGNKWNNDNIINKILSPNYSVNEERQYQSSADPTYRNVSLPMYLLIWIHRSLEP